MARPINARVGEQIRLLGYDVPDNPRPGSRFPVTLFWQTEQNIYDDYTAFVQLLDSDRNVVAKFDSVPGGGLGSTFLWLPGETVPDRVVLDLPHDLKPGLYTLVAGMYHYPELTRLPVVAASGDHSPDDVVELGEFKVAMNAQAARPEHTLDVSLGTMIRLLGYDLQVARGQADLKLYWQTREHIAADYKVFVHVLDEKGNLAAQVDRLPADGKYPTRIWEKDEKIVDVYALPIKNLAVGRYKIVVGMYAPETGERLRAVDANGHELPEYQVELGTFE
jgi:hypothetical protein